MMNYELMTRPPGHTLTLGLWKTKTELVEAFNSQDQVLTDYALSIIQNEKFVLLTEESSFEFIPAKVCEVVGRQEVVTPTELFDTMLRFGFCIAPHESAFALRLASLSHPVEDGYRRIVLHDPITNSVDEYSNTDTVIDPDSSWVYDNFANPGHMWYPDTRLWLCIKSKDLSHTVNFFT